MAINFYLQRDIRKKQFDNLCQLLRDGNIQDIDCETWALLADHLEGKIKAKRGPKHNDEKYNRDAEALSFYRELMRDGKTSEEAIFEIADYYEQQDKQDEENYIDHENIVRNMVDQARKTEKKLDQENLEKWRYILTRNSLPKSDETEN